jgi:HEAT repeat protein
VSWLESLATGDASRKLSSTAVMAIALHADPPAVDRLITLARSSPSSHVRGDAVFWVAQRAGDKAVGTITEVLDDPDSQIRTKAVFALSQLPKDEGIPKLIELARTHRDRAVRRQAMFWLGQSRDPRAIDFFEQLLRQ